MRGLDENARAVSGICFATASATMIQIQENAQRLTNDSVGFSTFDINEETNTASFMLELRIVQALFGGRPDERARLTRSGSGGWRHRFGGDALLPFSVRSSAHFIEQCVPKSLLNKILIVFT